jgi:hypothetical protein
VSGCGLWPEKVVRGRQTIFSFTHIESITLGAGEEVDEVSGGVRGTGVGRIGNVCDRASE